MNVHPQDPRRSDGRDRGGYVCRLSAVIAVRQKQTVETNPNGRYERRNRMEKAEKRLGRHLRSRVLYDPKQRGWKSLMLADAVVSLRLSASESTRSMVPPFSDPTQRVRCL